jgi:hypothetical protein
VVVLQRGGAGEFGSGAAADHAEHPGGKAGALAVVGRVEVLAGGAADGGRREGAAE